VIRVAVLTISDSAVAGTREDRSGPAVAEKAQALGWSIVAREVLRDQKEEIAAAMSRFIDQDVADMVITTGGTGLGPRDVTPEATKAVADRDIPGFGELMRAEGRKTARFASLSRGGAAARGAGLIVNLPGSPKGAVESLVAVADLIPHAVDLLQGRTEHKIEPQKAATDKPGEASKII
jgi:molybdenum cofactor synthesis domain-containing protein